MSVPRARKKATSSQMTPMTASVGSTQSPGGAEALGAAMVFNVKYETMSISKGASQTIGSVEVLAYGTALIDPHGR